VTTPASVRSWLLRVAVRLSPVELAQPRVRLSAWLPSATAVNLVVGGLQIKIRCLRCDGIAAVEVGNRATTVAKSPCGARRTARDRRQAERHVDD